MTFVTEALQSSPFVVTALVSVFGTLTVLFVNQRRVSLERRSRFLLELFPDLFRRLQLSVYELETSLQNFNQIINGNDEDPQDLIVIFHDICVDRAQKFLHDTSIGYSNELYAIPKFLDEEVHTLQVKCSEIVYDSLTLNTQFFSVVSNDPKLPKYRSLSEMIMQQASPVNLKSHIQAEIVRSPLLNHYYRQQLIRDISLTKRRLKQYISN